MSFINKLVVSMIMLLSVAGLPTVQAGIQTWNGGTGDWSEVANWTTAVPAAGDDVVITNRGSLVLLTSSTPWLSSLIVSNASLVCSNWNTTIYATNLTILSSGILTCAGPFTNNVMSNRVNLTCTTLYIEANGAINVQAKGYQGGLGPSYGIGCGPGGIASGNSIRSAGHGGMGSYGQSFDIPSNTYDSATAPIVPGSGGCGGNGAGEWGGHGGGAVCITALQVVVNGSINADATFKPVVGGHNSGGSGGSVYIVCATITGTNGVISANGGHSGLTSGYLGCGGGGGRISILYNTVAENAIAPGVSIRYSVASGNGDSAAVIPYGDIGTLYFTDSILFSATNLCTGQWLAPGLTNLAVSDWKVSNVWLRIPGLNVTVSNTLTVAGTNNITCKLEMTSAGTIACGNLRVSGASLCLGSFTFPYYRPNWDVMSGGVAGPTLNCATDIVVTNGGRLYVFAGLTHAGTEAGYGARVSVGGDVRVATNSWIFPVAHPTNGAVALFSMRNLALDYGGGFNAEAFGYGGGLRSGNVVANKACGPGVTTFNSGSGHGGVGTRSYYSTDIGGTYGSSNAPVLPGSGARCGYTTGTFTPYYGPWGGGSIQIRATDTVKVEGKITANGTNGVSNAGPGSSGGSIYITCRTFIGNSTGILQANGGWGLWSSVPGGGAGGGRIAVWRVFDRSAGVVSNSVNGGFGYSFNSAYTNCLTGGAGTIVWGWLVPPSGSIVSVY